MPDQTPGNSQFEVEQVTDIDTDLDPRLQKAILQKRAGVRIDPAVGKASHEGRVMMDVLVELRDPSQPVPGLNIGRPTHGIVTGTVDVNNISTVRRHPNIKSLKAARRVKPALKFSVPEVQATHSIIKAGLPQGSPEIHGAGVVIGVVDYGGDFVHNNFRNPDGTTRLRFLWDQGTGLETEISPAGFPYGREFTADAINAALASDNPYLQLAYDPGFAAHGTHVMDIAAGNGRATGAPGVAPKADLIFVQLASNDTAPEENFGNSRHLLDAVEYIFEKARLLNKPAVVNLSLGTNGGPHDGTSLVEKRIDQLLEEPGRAVVIAASNNWEHGIHASGRIAPGQQRVLRWELPQGDLTDNELEIWYGGSAKLDVSLVDPSGAQLGPFALGTTTLLKSGGVQVGAIFHRQNDPNNHDNQIDILLDSTLSGQWSIVLEASGAQPVHFHAWIERDDGGGSRFSPDDEDRSHTIGSIACGRKTIVVGSYDAKVPGRTISRFSAEGPTRDGRRKPEVSAPGQEVIAASSQTQTAFLDSGTSMAAPHVSGLIALLMQATPQALTTDQIRSAVLDFARRDPPNGTEWQARYGSGRINAAASVRSVVGFSPAGVTASPVSVTPELLVGNGNGNGHAKAYSFFEEAVAKLIENSAHSKIRLRLEIEVEPASTNAAS
jgi:subtilisin family serine protease